MNIKLFNELSLKELIKLPGIGRGTANRIIDRRSKYKFNTVNDLLKIKGIGLNTLKKLGIDPPEKKRSKSRAKKLEELKEYISTFSLIPKTPFVDLPYNTQIAFYEDLVVDTCQRPDLVRSSTGCIKCPYALLCKCYLRNFVSDRNKRNAIPTKKTVDAMIGNIDGYYHYKDTKGEPILSKLNIPND